VLVMQPHISRIVVGSIPKHSMYYCKILSRRPAHELRLLR
jgi:hypothetical protein